METADNALERLQRGNAEFVASLSENTTLAERAPRAELVAEQSPFAIVLGCSDARVPAEIVFNQGLGDLFVIRVAGNVVAPSLIGSVEFAAAKFGTRLVVVLGHTQCGAVAATLEEMQQPTENQSPNLKSIVDRVWPSVAPLFDTELRHDHKALAAEAVRANVRRSVEQLRHGSDILEDLLQNDGLRIVGAEYAIETGQVTFLD